MSNEILEAFVCQDCERKARFLSYTKEMGRVGNLMYSVKESNACLLKVDKSLFRDENVIDFLLSDGFENYFVPKFGKFEIEHYIATRLRNAIFGGNDLTDIFNMYIVCEHIKVTPIRIKEKLNDILTLIEVRDYTKVYELDLEKLNIAIKKYYNSI